MSSDVLGVTFFAAIAVVGAGSTILAGVWTWRYLRRRTVTALPAAVIVGFVVILAFWGLWLLFDVVWIVATLAKLMVAVTRGPRMNGPSKEN
jgi:hypothetical protein